MELKQLRYFVAVAEQLSFSEAGRRLFISQQALSRIIRQLEHELGVRLFERTTRTVTLTAAGEALLAAVPPALAQVDAAVESALRADGRAGPLRVDICSAGLRTGAQILRTLRRECPDRPIHQVEEGVSLGLAALADGRLDILFGLASHRRADLPARLLRYERVLVGMAPGHHLARLPAVPVAALRDTQLLLPSDTAAGEWTEFVTDFCTAAGVIPERWPGTVHGPVAVAELLRESSCVVPTLEWTQPPADIVFRPLVEPTPIFPWSMMIAPKFRHTVEYHTVIRSIQSVAEENRWEFAS
ncbi:LysR family transcriptional regulator [Nocardia sp. CDC160]|uniref:LysR family transcriptional regulator n=1 Tax=Nocardia sp. CDC160 TaxID=3112166 RepID=UPI002DBCE9EF|nr:LysR family transcriptional regulator [Nocardia sp. CDC160]MEC3917641.1 LysR family transcriptional regulator [Nocardia sp. CDC160]